jgi:predicted nuclease of predicted toxin-antitoxin system
MAAYLVDEDMPRSTARMLRGAGYDAADVRDIGLAGRPDDEVFDAAQRMRAVLITADREFDSLPKFPLGTHAGIILTRTPNKLPILHLNNLILQALWEVHGEDLAGVLMVIEVGRTRVRRPSPQ